MHYALIFLLSIITSLSFIFWINWLFAKKWILDNPQKYWYKRNPVPYWVWIFFFINFFILTFIFLDFSEKLFLIWIFWFLITVVSFLDDLFDISAKVRLFIQIMVWVVIWLTSIKIWYISNIFGWIINLETYNFVMFDTTVYIFPIILTTIWYILILNSLNWSDWVRWVTTGVSWISYLVILFLAIKLLIVDDYPWSTENANFIIIMSIILLWSIISFWYFDYKEKALMWDSWTMFLGFMLATLAIISWGKIATVSVVFWIYLIDAFYVILWRLKNKKSPLNKDFTHLHHRLRNVGLSKNEILAYIYILSLIFWFSALFLDKTWKIIVFIIIALVVIFLSNILSKIKNKWK